MEHHCDVCASPFRLSDEASTVSYSSSLFATSLPPTRTTILSYAVSGGRALITFVTCCNVATGRQITFVFRNVSSSMCFSRLVPTTDESNANVNANANAQHLNQMQIHLYRMQMQLDQMQM